MATIRFYTRSKDLYEPALVSLCFQDRDKIKIRFATSYKLIPSFWNEKKQRLISSIENLGHSQWKRALKTEEVFNQLRHLILNEYTELESPASKEWLQGIINGFQNKKPGRQENLNHYIKRFIDEARTGKRLANSGNTKKRYSRSSVRNLNDFKNSWNLFQGIEPDEYEPKKKRNGKDYPKQPYKPLNFNDVTIDTYNEFIKYFYSRDCGANYIGKHIKSLKTIMRQAREEGLHDNMEIERKAFKTISEPVEHIYLTENELESLRKVDLKGNKHLETIRDVFLAGCYTAQRFSDYSKINSGNIKEINGNKVIELIQIKTGEKCIIPIRPELEEILRRYNYTLPKTFEQKVNEKIKIIGEKAGITELIEIEQNKGGLKVKTSVRKCDLIKTHCARRTGATNMYLAGIPSISIMKITGHKTEREFLKYIRISKEETAVKLATHPYFKGTVLKVAN